jgi:hypothetical protein
MINVLKFPDRSARTEIQEFLQEDEDILRFETSDASGAGRVATFATIEKRPFPFSGKIQLKDWTNQELADLFRVKRLLDIAGVLSDIERGITDEGDPWFVFCDTRGEVFIHLCRLDGLYLLDSPNISSPLSGKDFKDLIDSFTQKKFLAQHENEDVAASGHRLVTLDRNGKVFLHPSTMLAALIWSLFLASEDIVMILPKDTDDLVDGLEGLISVSEDVTHDINPDAAQALRGFDTHPNGTLGEEVSANAKVQSSKDLLSLNLEKITQNAYAIGLSAVAISLRFMSETLVSDIDNSTLEGLAALSVLGEADKNYHLLEKTGLETNQSPEFLTAMSEFFETSFISANETTETLNAKQEEHLEANIFFPAEGKDTSSNSKVTDYEDHAAIDSTQRVNMDEIGSDFVSGNHPIEALTLAGLPSRSEARDTENQISQRSLLDKLFSLSSDVIKYTLNDMKVNATFDIYSSESNGTTSLIDTSETGPSNQPHKQFDDSAFDWISHFIDINDDIEMISLEGEIILFDLSALNAAPGDTIIMSWSLQNGDVITMVGLGSEYDAFGLIA